MTHCQSKESSGGSKKKAAEVKKQSAEQKKNSCDEKLAGRTIKTTKNQPAALDRRLSSIT